MTNMPDETNIEPESIVKPDAPGDLETLDQMIAADEAALAQNSRDSKGRFAEAKTGAPAQRLTPEKVSAKTGTTTTKAGDDTAAPASKPETEANTQPDESKAEGDGTKPKSAYEKAKERQDGAWKTINATKSELELREKALEARERASRSGAVQQEQQNGRGNASGSGASAENVYTAGDYTKAAGDWEAQAGRLDSRVKQLEESGDFGAADRCAEQAKELRGLAQEARAAASTAPAQRPVPSGNGRGQVPQVESESDVRRQWAVIKTDLPEVLVAGSPMNAAVQEFIARNPAVLSKPDGVMRAVLQTGRNVVAKLEREAMRVPELQKANAALSEKIKGLEGELQRVTSLPGGSGYQRGESGRSFDQLTTKEQEAQLDREMAGHL